jgi:hypothetical protein
LSKLINLSDAFWHDQSSQSNRRQAHEKQTKNKREPERNENKIEV